MARRPRLTLHFAAREFDCRDGTPWPTRYLMDAVILSLELEHLRARFGPCTVLSGYRTRRHNARVGGAPSSFHVWDARPEGSGVAADVRFARGRPRHWAEAAAQRPRIGGIGTYTDFVHIDTRSARTAW